MITSSSIKAQARRIGFDLCGISPVDSFPELDFLKEWLEKGYAGEMAWMTRSAQRRADVRNVIPDARSVIVTGTLYNSVPPDKVERQEPGAGSQEPARAKVSRYAWGDDYHDVVKRRLDALLAWMREQSDTERREVGTSERADVPADAAPFEARAYVDTGPVQERVYAQYAGLGWIGKNACLINPELGSYLFLSEIICTLPLEPDTQGLEQCGTCTRCLEACPTGALVEPGVLDSNRCLSYLTIELRAGIPEPLREAIGTHVYGCDICQDVCPYNQVPPRSADLPWQPRPGLAEPPLADLWRRSDTELKALVRRGPMTRAKLTGLRRNLAVAIGNSRDADALAALEETIADQRSTDDPMVQEHIEWALAVGQRSE